jgi:dipeptidyl aminopeptidase/acylaminoacyl peptidase
MPVRLFLLHALIVTASLIASAQSDAPAYQKPPQAIADIMDAAPPPSVALSPLRDVIALVPRRSMPAIAELGRPWLGLAGTRIDPANSGLRGRPGGTGITLRTIATSVERTVQLPPDAHIALIGFSPDGTRLAFTDTRDTRIDLHLVDVATGASRQAGAALNTVVGGCGWLTDSSALLCPLVPADRGAPPAAPSAPSGPNIQETSGPGGPIRTFQDLLTSAHDEQLFEHYASTQLAFIDAATGRASPVGTPGIVTGTASPDGQYVLVSRVKRPFSRLLPWVQFSRDVEVWNRRGDKLRTLADMPMGDTIPMNGVITGPRGHRWIPLDPSTLVWAEALDKGDIKNKVPHRDRIVTLSAPFTAQPVEVARTQYRYGGSSWTDTGTILLTESDRVTRTTRTWVLDARWGEPRKLWDRKQQDRYGDPGSPVFRPDRQTILQHGDTIYLSGQGASPDGDRPFLDRLNLRTFATERLFRSDAASFESFVGLLDEGGGRVVTRRESRMQPPNLFIRDLRAGTEQAISRFTDPHPQLTQAMADRLFVTYKRKDGVGLSGTIYLPVGYQRGRRVPMLVWAYPQEFVDTDAASQVVGSPNRYTSVTGSSHLLLLTQGYAIFDGPTMPIVGPGETANDKYIEQLVASAEAAVDKAVELGIADRNRIAVGGHSYGAFMTANLLAHSDLFVAGIARSGAYNRTLTPFGFQAETRTFWEVPEVYAKMSPFWHAHTIKEPILLVHGEADDNTGTFPIQSERFYMALKGHGGTARYVTLPHESHGYLARESNMHVVAEMLNWLDDHVKNAEDRSPTSRPR